MFNNNNSFVPIKKIGSLWDCDVLPSGVYELQDERSSLAICNLKLHQGIYTCTATNRWGSATKNANVTIEGKEQFCFLR